MDIAALRERLHDYIRNASDKKIEALYVIVGEEDIDETEWWQDENTVREFEQRYNDWMMGRDKGYTLNEVQQSVREKKNDAI